MRHMSKEHANWTVNRPRGAKPASDRTVRRNLAATHIGKTCPREMDTRRRPRNTAPHITYLVDILCQPESDTLSLRELRTLAEVDGRRPSPETCRLWRQRVGTGSKQHRRGRVRQWETTPHRLRLPSVDRPTDARIVRMISAHAVAAMQAREAQTKSVIKTLAKMDRHEQTGAGEQALAYQLRRMAEVIYMLLSPEDYMQAIQDGIVEAEDATFRLGQPQVDALREAYSVVESAAMERYRIEHRKSGRLRRVRAEAKAKGLKDDMEAAYVLDDIYEYVGERMRGEGRYPWEGVPRG